MIIIGAVRHLQGKAEYIDIVFFRHLLDCFQPLPKRCGRSTRCGLRISMTVCSRRCCNFNREKSLSLMCVWAGSIIFLDPRIDRTARKSRCFYEFCNRFPSLKCCTIAFCSSFVALLLIVITSDGIITNRKRF